MLRGSGEENKAQKRVPPEAKCENMKCEVIRVTETPGDSKMTDQGDSQKQKSKEEKRMLGEC